MSVACPSCQTPMTQAFYASKQGGRLELDFCFACQLIWLDQYESAQLAPTAVIDLFKQLTTAQPANANRAVLGNMHCIRCGDDLLETHDQVRSNKFVYHRCAGGHGRMIGFWHFLREKQFVRDLSSTERQQLSAQVAQVKCSSCGAAVDVRQHDCCQYCRAPLAILDRDAVAKVLAEYQEKASPTHAMQQADAIIANERRNQGVANGKSNQHRNIGLDSFDIADLVGDVLSGLLKTLD